MTEWPDRYIQANGIDIHYYRTGSANKPSIILLHGVMDSGQCWPRVARDLQERFDVIMPDARGHGRTAGSLEGLSYNVLAADVAALIHALDLEKPYFFGHSMGAITAATVAANYPQLARAIILEDPPLKDAAPANAGKEEADQQVLRQGILSLKALSPEERLVAARMFNPKWDEIELAPWAEAKVEFNLEFFQYLAIVAPWRELLPHIACPILLVTGDPESHAIVTPEIAQQATRLWQNGEVVQVPGAGHSIHRDRYDETMAPIQAFLSRV
jgi:N-formylmaleamate deformylase